MPSQAHEYRLWLLSFKIEDVLHCPVLLNKGKKNISVKSTIKVDKIQLDNV